MPKVRFLHVNANSLEQARIGSDPELRDIQEELDDAADLFVAPAARLTDLRDKLRVHRPHIVHFSAHGNAFGGNLMLFDDEDQPYGAHKDSIRQLFEPHRDTVKLVVLNACYTEQQARLIHEFVDSVIGVSDKVGEDVARKYAKFLYRYLRKEGKHIKDAHLDVENVVVRDERVAPEHRPRLFSRAVGTQGILFPKLNTDLEYIRRTRADEYKKAVRDHGIAAGSLHLRKQCYEDGMSVLTYKVEDLAIVGDARVEGLRFFIESSAGLVHDPILDPAARGLHIYWEPDVLPAPTSLKDVINGARMKRGVLRFPQSLTAETGPYSFGWSVKVHNMDAIDTWDFANLYREKKDRLHVDGSPLEPPCEYIARLCWLPAASMSIRVELPPALNKPARFRCFYPKPPLPAIAREDILAKGLLLSVPPHYGSGQCAWKWEPRLQVEDSEGAWVSFNGLGATEVSLPHPTVGSWCGLQWDVVEQSFNKPQRDMIQDAEAIRMRLVEHRKARLRGGETKRSRQIYASVLALHQWLREQFPGEVDEEIFETVLMTYDAKAGRLVVCEALTGEGAPADRSNWDFELPYGMGLAGACFRSGAVFAYAREDRDASEAETYLRVPESHEHEYLLAFPIDHPGLKRENPLGNLPRSRQLAAVVTVGTTYGPSRLKEFCLTPPEDEGRKERRESLERLRDECQVRSNFLLWSLLGRSKTVQ